MNGEYGLKVENAGDPETGEYTRGCVCPYDDEVHGCDWEAIKPDWIEDHGTVIVLLGESPAADTVQGDPNRTEQEADIKGLRSYLNRRMWEVDQLVQVFVDEFAPRTADSGHPPKS